MANAERFQKIELAEDIEFKPNPDGGVNLTTTTIIIRQEVFSNVDEAMQKKKRDLRDAALTVSLSGLGVCIFLGGLVMIIASKESHNLAMGGAAAVAFGSVLSYLAPFANTLRRNFVSTDMANRQIKKIGESTKTNIN